MPSNGVDLELRAFRVHAPASLALRDVLSTLHSTDMDVFYAIRSRAKPVKKIIEKTGRKRRDGKLDYEPDDITDVAGIRVVTLFREDVIDALKIFLRLIKHEGIYSSNSPFVKDELKEGIIFTTASVGDPEAITSRLRSVFDAAGHPLKDDDIRQVETGYSSIHLVAFCNVTQEKVITKVPIEIQIRTVFEDAWGEIDHKLRYSLNRSRSQASDALLESWQPHLNVLKTFTDGCGQYAGIIKNQAIDTRSRSSEIGPFVPVETSGDALAQCGNVSKALQDSFENAYAGRSAAIEAGKSAGPDSAEVNQKFLEAANLFSLAYDFALKETFPTPRQRDAAIFFCRMEKAFCLLSTGKKPSIDEAIQIYSEVQEHAPNSTVVYYRYGQALAKLGEIDAAITKYLKAEALLATDQFIPPKHWLRLLIPRNLGFLTWSKSLLCPDDPEGREMRMDLLIDAFEHTKRSYAASSLNTDNHTRGANNALYYAIEYMALLGSVEDGKIKKIDAEPFLKTLESKIDLATAPHSQLNWIDTLCRADALFGKTERAVLAAERIEHLMSGVHQSPPDGRGGSHHSKGNPTHAFYAITSGLNDRERDVLDHALWILRKYGPGPERPAGEPRK